MTKGYRNFNIFTFLHLYSHGRIKIRNLIVIFTINLFNTH